MSPGATLTKEAPDALRTPNDLLPPLATLGARRAGGRTTLLSNLRDDERPKGVATTRRPQPPLDRKPITSRVPKSSQANHPPASYIETRSQGGINTNSRGGTVTAVICATFPSATVRLVSQN
jgi:hypothetical protein